MRAFLLAALLLFTQGAYATEGEPFGVQFYTRSNDQVFELQIKFQTDVRYKKIAADVASQVRHKPKEEWLTWINLLVNTSVELTGPSLKEVCARKAVAKDEVMRLLELPKAGRRLVGGTTSMGPHIVVAVRSPSGWLILDSVRTGVGYKPALESQLKGFKAEQSFN